MVKKYIWNVLIAIDQLANTLLFFGDPQETISSRLGKHLANHDKCPVCNLLCKFLNLFQKDHCIKAIEPDQGSDAIFKG
jgi:hypothetical protein